MNIRSYAFDLITFLVFSWKCGKASRSETSMKTWKQAVLDCYGNNSFLESNITILQQYMISHTKVKGSIWVGSFEALLPWIEIRGCYNIPLTCNNLGKDETNAANLQLCQVKCMKRQYFAFNQKNERCVCFDEHEVVRKVTENASLCTNRGDRNTHAVVYKVFDRPITLADNDHDCLSYQCSSSGSMPIFSTKECYTYSRSYCRDGRKAVSPVYQHFWQYHRTCEEKHFTYPLLYSENQVELCNVTESLTPGTDVWVGVYRQKLYIDDADTTVSKDFDKIEQYISRCDYLPTIAGSLKEAENCSKKHHYICSSDTPIEFQKEPNNSSTSSPVCWSKDQGETDDQSSGIIIGIVISISVLVLTILVILAFMYRRRYAKENAPLNTACREDRYINDIDNNTVISDYQQLDNVDDVKKITNAYDQLHVTRNVHTESTNDQANTSFSREEYSKYESIVDYNGINTNTVISEYEELHKADKDTSTQKSHAYDQLNVKTDPTTFFKNESIKAISAPSEYEQLDNAKKDKSVNVYDELHATDMIDNKQTNYNSKTTKSKDKHSKNEQIKETVEMNHMRVTSDMSEYEHLDNAKKDQSVNVYDQLDVANVMSNDPTHYNPCQ